MCMRACVFEFMCVFECMRVLFCQGPRERSQIKMKENKAPSARSSDRSSMAANEEMMPEGRIRTAFVTIQKTIK